MQQWMVGIAGAGMRRGIIGQNGLNSSSNTESNISDEGKHFVTNVVETKNSSMQKLAFYIFLAFATVTFTYAQQPPTNIVNGLDAIFQGHVNQTLGFVPGHVIRVEKPGEWIYENASGLASLNPTTNVQSEMKFKVASITKMFTTVAIIKLIQNGQLDWNAPISNYLPMPVVQNFDDYPNIRIRNLLSHTSGIREPQTDFQGRLNYWIYMKRFDEIPLDSLFFWSYGSSFGVGNYNYSNANFYVLAEIIEAVTGTTYQNYITNNIINPLGLTNTDFNRIPTGNFMRGYLKGTFYEQGSVPDGLDPDSLYDFTEASNSWGYGAADIWSNTTDLIQFHKALFNGQLIDSNWLDTMKTILTITGDMGSYGYGMIQFNSYNNGPVYGFGHTGTAFGYGAMLNYIPSLDVYICSAGNYMKIGQEFLQRDIYNFLNLNMSTNLAETELVGLVDIFPNPVADRLQIRSTHQNFQVSMMDHTGKLVIQRNNSRILDLTDLPAGIYLLRVKDFKSNTSVTKKVVRN
jgi:D-alanyl-D-alanine carboxypeptidase